VEVTTVRCSSHHPGFSGIRQRTLRTSILCSVPSQLVWLFSIAMFSLDQLPWHRPLRTTPLSIGNTTGYTNIGFLSAIVILKPWICSTPSQDSLHDTSWQALSKSMRKSCILYMRRKRRGSFSEWHTAIIFWVVTLICLNLQFPRKEGHETDVRAPRLPGLLLQP